MSCYNDKLDASDQIDTEESIAATIFDFINAPIEERNAAADEEGCAQLGRDILLLVLKKFRPDMIEEEDPLNVLQRLAHNREDLPPEVRRILKQATSEIIQYIQKDKLEREPETVGRGDHRITFELARGLLELGLVRRANLIEQMGYKYAQSETNDIKLCRKFLAKIKEDGRIQELQELIERFKENA